MCLLQVLLLYEVPRETLLIFCKNLWKIFDYQLAISRRKWWCPNEIFSYPSQTTKPHNNISSTHSLLKILWKYFSFVRSNCCTFLYELWIRNDFAPVQNDDDRASVVARRSPLPPLLLTTFTKVHQKLIAQGHIVINLYAPCWWYYYDACYNNIPQK